MDKDIRSTIGTAATLEQLAKSCAKLSEASLAISSVLRGDNPAGTNLDKMKKSMNTAYQTLLICAKNLELEENPTSQENIMWNWMKRLKDTGAIESMDDLNHLDKFLPPNFMEGNDGVD